MALRGGAAIEPAGSDDLPSPRVTPGMKLALQAGVVVFAVGVLVPLVAIAWVAIVASVMGVSGSILVRTGGLEPRTFGTCVTAAIVLDAVLLLAIAVTAIARRAAPDPEADPEAERPPESAYSRHPVAVTAAGLLLALGGVTVAGWNRSPYFPYPLATIVTLANAYFFILMGVLYTGAVLDKIWSPIKAWGLSSPYRTGLLTATLILLGIGGFALRKSHWQRAKVQQLAAHVELAPLRAAAGFIDAQLVGLCIAADEVAPELARSSSAPACELLGDGGDGGGSALGVLGSGPDCFTTLAEEIGAGKTRLRSTYRISTYDADDIVMDALLKTCLREPPPDDLRAYFFTVMRNQAVRVVQSGRRTLTCDNVDERAPPPSCSSTSSAYREHVLQQVWDYTFCTLEEQPAAVLRSRLVDGLRFREIGARWRLREEEARYIFHNAVKKLRRELGDCLRDDGRTPDD
ncbi:MAG TPA: sigma-70 family RNA polymerase sigma factor [Kofleriaceae bacterium]|nr:sigma-70 family RNA polymerase sigma factor [Kofleriaceae bacterium]